MPDTPAAYPCGPPKRGFSVQFALHIPTKSRIRGFSYPFSDGFSVKRQRSVSLQKQALRQRTFGSEKSLTNPLRITNRSLLKIYKHSQE